MNRITISILSLLFFSNSIFAQEGIIYEKEITVENATKEELFLKARYWMTAFFDQSDKQLLIEDEVEGRLLAHSSFFFLPRTTISHGRSATGPIEYDIDITVEDGAYTYRISDFTHIGDVRSPTSTHYGFISKEDLCTTQKPRFTSKKRMRKICEDLKEQIEEEVRKLISSLAVKMKKEGVSQVNELVHPNGIVYSEFVEIENMSKAEIYEKCRLWFAKNFSNSNEVLELENKELGELFGKSSIFYKSRFFGRDNTIGEIWFNIRLQIKDNGYQYTISDFEHIADPTNEAPQSYEFISTEECCYGKSKRKKISKYKRKTCEELKAMIEYKAKELTSSLQYTVGAIEEKELLEDQAAEGEIIFSKVVAIEGRSKEVLFKNGRLWLNSFIENSSEQIEIQDEAAGELYVKNFMKYNPPLLKGGGLTSKGAIWYDLRIQVRDGQYKFTVSNFDHVASLVLETPISFGILSSEEICFRLKNVGLTKKRKRKYCNYLNKCIVENMVLLEESLVEMMQRK